MNYLCKEYPNAQKGGIIKVTLSGAANVRLMDPTNYRRYTRCDAHDYYGEYVTKSPCYIKVPYTGRWCVTVDLGGYEGRVTAEIEYIQETSGSSFENNSRPTGRSYEEEGSFSKIQAKKMDGITANYLSRRFEEYKNWRYIDFRGNLGSSKLI
jgi:hypothetical protein